MPTGGRCPRGVLVLVLVASVGCELTGCGRQYIPAPVDAAVPPRPDGSVERPVVQVEPDAGEPGPAVDAAPMMVDAPPDAPPPMPRAAQGDVPAPWRAYLVGDPEGGGSADFAGDAFTVKGSGRDIYDTLGFTFVAQPLAGDGGSSRR